MASRLEGLGRHVHARNAAGLGAIRSVVTCGYQELVRLLRSAALGSAAYDSVGRPPDRPGVDGA